MLRIPVHRGNYPVPPTPYANQTAVDQHKRAQPAPLPPRTSLGSINVQSPKQVQPPQLLDSVQPQRLPFVDVPLAPAKNHQTDNTSSPFTLETTSKSVNRQGVKQSSSESSSASTSTGKSGPICWNCQEVGHRRCNCKNPSYCSKCKQSGHLPVKCPLKGKKTEKSQTQQKGQQTSVDPMFSNFRNICIHCGGDHAPGPCPMKTRLQATQNAAGYQTYDNGASTGKANANHLPSFSSKSGQPTAANMLQVLQRNWRGHRDILLVPESQPHHRLVPILHNKTSIACRQCTHQTILHHLLIFQFCSRHHLLHLLMCLMHIQPLCQTFQLHSA